MLNSRDPERVDVTVAVACIFNSYAWGCYAYIVQDLFVFIPNVAAFFAGCINIVLFMWTQGYLADSSFLIKVLNKCCNSGKKMLPNKIKCESELENEGLFSLKNQPADGGSHVLIERRKDTEEDSNDFSSDEEQAIEIHLDEKTEKTLKRKTTHEMLD